MATRRGRGAASENFAALVGRVTARLKPPPVVSPEQYRGITCNRCGLCCEDIRVPDPPERIAALAVGDELDADRRRFLSGLVPGGRIAGGWSYRCRHFRRDGDGVGVCGIWQERPSVCSRDPYQRVVRTWSQCAWYVEVRDGESNVIDRVEDVPDTRKPAHVEAVATTRSEA